MKPFTLVGVRPQFIKAMQFSAEFRKLNKEIPINVIERGKRDEDPSHQLIL